MITFKVRRCGNGKRSRGFPKFVRGTKKFKNFEGSHMRMRGLYGGIGIVHVAEYLEKFLLANVGKPIDKVYSEFLKRCGKSVRRYNLKREFYRSIQKMESLTIRREEGIYSLL